MVQEGEQMRTQFAQEFGKPHVVGVSQLTFPEAIQGGFYPSAGRGFNGATLFQVWKSELRSRRDAQGEHVLEQGEAARRTIDPGPTRELSVFQWGLRWLKRCVSTNLSRLPAFAARLSPLKHLRLVRAGIS